MVVEEEENGLSNDQQDMFPPMPEFSILDVCPQQAN